MLPASRFRTAVCRNPIRRIPSRPTLLLQFRQFLHGLQSGLCQVNDTNFSNIFLKHEVIRQFKEMSDLFHINEPIAILV